MAITLTLPNSRSLAAPQKKVTGTMDIITGFCCMAAASMAIVGASTQIQLPGIMDLCCFVGSILAAMLAGIKARYEEKSYLQLTSVILSSVIVGTIGPMITIWFLIVGPTWFGWKSIVTDDVWYQIPATVWAGFGLVFGLLGWTIIHIIQTLGVKKLERVAKEKLESRINEIRREAADTTKIQ